MALMFQNPWADGTNRQAQTPKLNSVPNTLKRGSLFWVNRPDRELLVPDIIDLKRKNIETKQSNLPRPSSGEFRQLSSDKSKPEILNPKP